MQWEPLLTDLAPLISFLKLTWPVPAALLGLYLLGRLFSTKCMKHAFSLNND